MLAYDLIGSNHDALISNGTAKQMEDDVSLNIELNLPRILWKGKLTATDATRSTILLYASMANWIYRPMSWLL